MTHKGCALDGRDAAIAYSRVRAFRLVLAHLYDDDDASGAAVDEIEDCAACLRALVSFLAGLSGSIGVGLAEKSGEDHAAAARQFEKQLAEAIDELPPG